MVYHQQTLRKVLNRKLKNNIKKGNQLKYKNLI